MALSLRRRSLTRLSFLIAFACFAKLLLGGSSSTTSSAAFYASRSDPYEIKEHGVLDLVRGQEKTLDVQRHKFLQVRMGRDDRPDLLDDIVRSGVDDFWDRFERPYILSSDTSITDTQSLLSSIDQLLSLNGWVAALCPTLTRPFGQNHRDSSDPHDPYYSSLSSPNHLYFIGIVIHSADHFLVDQLAVIVQMAKRLGASNLFVSMLDYASSDSTETLTDLCEAVLTLLSIPFRIRRVSSMTADPAAAYYPLEEATMRNLALEPLRELWQKRKIKFYRVVWLKGFTCPNDILETIKVSVANEAAMVCGMDWAKHNDFFIFSDRWRTRDIEGDQFRQSRSSSKPDAVPPRDPVGAKRYAQHLPFQVFCCESGTHVVDPAQSYYAGIYYRSGMDYWNATEAADPGTGGTIQGGPPQRAPSADCLDSCQAWFCRDLWIHKAKEGMRDRDEEADEEGNAARFKKFRRQLLGERAPAVEVDADANVGSDYDAMEEGEGEGEEEETTPVRLSVPNSVFPPARIMVNPRCVTTYADVSHTQLALDLFGPERDNEEPDSGMGKYVLEDWEGAPESFVCQEQRQTGGRSAPKTQRRLEFSIHDAIERST